MSSAYRTYGRADAGKFPLRKGNGWKRLTDLALYASIALVLARAMMLQIVREPIQVEVGQQPIPRGPGAAEGLILDLLCFVPALLVLLRGAVDRNFTIHRSLAHLLLLLLGLWSAASVMWSSDKFLAAISASHFFAALTMLWTFSQLVREWRQLRLVAAGAFALLLVLTAQGLIYKYVDLPELHRALERDWPEILRERGWEADSFIAIQFKKRVLGGEVMGFSASPNTMGAMLVMLGIVSAGLIFQRIREREESGWALAMGLALLPAIWVLWFTGSRTALATPILAAMLLLIFWNARAWIAAHRALVFFISLLLILISAAALVAHGVYHGTLLHDSLTFRWKYWIGAWRIFMAHSFVGVGFANFGLYYLGTRLPEAAEEINDPHNFIVRIFAELGAVGGTILIAGTLRLWWELTNPNAPADSHAEDPARTSAIVPLLWISIIATAIATFAAVDFSQQWEYGFVEVLKRLLYALLLLMGLTVGVLRMSRGPQMEDRAARWVLYSTLAALAVFLVHNLVDFSLFEPGAMFAFTMLAGGALGMRLTTAMRRGVVISLLAGATVAWAVFAIAVVAPVVVSEHEARLGDAELRRGLSASAAGRFHRAFSSLWIPNPDYAFRAARALVLADADPDEIRGMIDAAIGCSPASVRYHRMRAELESKLPHPDPDAAIRAFQRVVELDPNDVATRVDFAEMLAKFGHKDRALEQYRIALKLNDTLDAAEPERLTPARLEQIRRKMQSLQE